jgi:hypothetical protein
MRREWHELPAKRRNNILNWATGRYAEWKRIGLDDVAEDLAAALRALRAAARKPKMKGRR